MGLSIKMVELQLKSVPELRLNMEIMAGERIGLTGSNGVGKSSLLRYLSCLERPVAMGQLLLDGCDPFHAHDMEKLRGQTAYLLQEPEQGIVFSNISQDAIFGPENLAVEPEIIRKRWKGLAEKLLDRDKVDFRELSGGQKQRAALVSALMMRAPLLLLDEPFSMLGRDEAEEILSFLIGMSKRLDQTMVLVSHDPDVLRTMDRVLAMDERGFKEICYRKGRWIYKADGSEYESLMVNNESTAIEAKTADILPEEDIPGKRGVLRVEKSKLQIPPVRERQEDTQSEAEVDDEKEELFVNPELTRVEGVDTVEVFSPVISLDKVSFRYGTDQVIKDFSAAVYPGILYELTGGTGSGKTTLCKLMNGTLAADKGDIKVKGIQLPIKSPGNGRRAAYRGQAPGELRKVRQIVGYVMQHPEDQLFASTVLDDVMYGPLKSGKSKEAARQDAEDALSLLGIGPAFWKKAPEKLSGGEMRRVAIAGVLAMKPEVFILDEPFAGLDPEGEELLREVLREYVRQGRTVIITSHGRRKPEK